MNIMKVSSQPLSLNILVVEDDPAFNYELGMKLQESGHKISGSAYNAYEAVKLFEQTRPDIVMMDMVMPDHSTGREDQRAGLTAAKKILQIGEVPIILLTAYETPELISDAGDAGINAYMVKPASTNDIIRTIAIAYARFGDIQALRKVTKELELEIAERNRTEKTLRKAKIELEEAIETKNRIFSIIGHDLGNAYTNIVLGADILVDDESSSESVREVVRNLYTAAANQQILLNNLLEWSKLQTGRITPKPILFDLNGMISDTIEIFQGAADTKNIKIRYESGHIHEVFADPEMIKLILRNLINNAVKFTPVGGLVLLQAEENNLTVQIRVVDTGIGMNAETLEKLLKLKEGELRTSGTMNERGSGLGLKLCREFITLNGGSISVESEEGKGSTFSVILHKPA